MVIKSDAAIYKALEKHLRATKQPLTCVDLYKHADVRGLATDANRVSDFLGHMWRRGLLERFAAPKTNTSFARWAYQWKAEQEDSVKPAPILPPTSPHSKLPPHIDISEDGKGAITITYSDFVITIQPR